MRVHSFSFALYSHIHISLSHLDVVIHCIILRKVHRQKRRKKLYVTYTEFFWYTHHYFVRKQSLLLSRIFFHLWINGILAERILNFSDFKAHSRMQFTFLIPIRDQLSPHLTLCTI